MGQVMERFVNECTPVVGGYVPDEVLLSCSLAHPNLVRGYRYATRTVKGVPATHGGFCRSAAGPMPDARACLCLCMSSQDLIEVSALDRRVSASASYIQLGCAG